MDFCCKVLDRGIQQGVYSLMTSGVIRILYNAEALRGDGAGAFSIYAVHICYLWEGPELPVLCLQRFARCVILLTVMCCLLYWRLVC